MLTGALDGSAASLALVFAAVVIGAAVSLWIARRGGRRPVIMQAAIVAAIVVALAYIAIQATEVDGLLSALRGPLPNVLLLLVVLHGFETVDRRTLRVHLAITFVLDVVRRRAADRRQDRLVARGVGHSLRGVAAHDDAPAPQRRRTRRASSTIDATPSGRARFGEGEPAAGSHRSSQLASARWPC